ncbi:MAG: Gfo/Idh/MocA family oxidoreductase [Verrucomicrobia bacterium]|nr:Gfo/Idh/MocA family oxidoreductase [Verrucomicrobiota bacterium]MBV8640947.1 Gfo/Idh/MocA family oxidoreductase [Verrucomicrobiota bacterium]
MNKLRIGVVGCGPIAQNAHLPAIEKARDIRLQAIADTDAGLREAVAQRYHAHSALSPEAIRTGHIKAHGLGQSKELRRAGFGLRLRFARK